MESGGSSRSGLLTAGGILSIMAGAFEVLGGGVMVGLAVSPAIRDRTSRSRRRRLGRHGCEATSDESDEGARPAGWAPSPYLRSGVRPRMVLHPPVTGLAW